MFRDRQERRAWPAPLSVGVGLFWGILAIVLLAQPAAAQTCPNAEFRQGPAAKLPDCRAYEMVSPPDKNGSDVYYGELGVVGPSPVQSSGGALGLKIYSSTASAPFGGTDKFSQYLVRRTEEGWVTVSAQGRPNPPATLQSSSIRPGYRHNLIETSAPMTADESPHGGLYLLDAFSREIRFLLPGIGNQGLGSDYAAIWKPDGSGFYFITKPNITGEPGISAGESKVWLWQEGEGFSLASVLPDGTPVEGQIGTYHSGAGWKNTKAVTENGDVFFTSPRGSSLNAAQKVYLRSGEQTVMVTPSVRTDCAGDPTCGGDGIPDPAPDPEPGGKEYATSATDGSKVFFTSPELLTDDANTGTGRGTNAPRDLYRYDLAQEELLALSADPSTPDGGRVLGLLGASTDGDTIYYVAEGLPVAGGTDGSPNVYRWRDDGSGGSTRFIATLAPEDSDAWSGGPTKTSRVSDDGRHLLFLSQQDLTSHPNASGERQVFRYDADGAGGQGEMLCLSCNPFGGPPAGEADLGEVTAMVGTHHTGELPRALSSDGRRALFNSTDALVPEDVNGALDAYLWEEGELHLLATGQHPEGSRLFGMSSDGDEAFFLTRERLTGWDGDHATDLYVAKVGGGFPQPEPAVRCALAADLCQPQTTSAVQLPFQPQTDSSGPVENTSPSVGRRLAVLPLRGRALQRAGRHGVIPLTVRASVPGRVRAVAWARLRGKLRRVAVARQRVEGRSRLRLRLNRSARRALTRRGALRVRVRVDSRGAPSRQFGTVLRRGGTR